MRWLIDGYNVMHAGDVSGRSSVAKGSAVHVAASSTNWPRPWGPNAPARRPSCSMPPCPPATSPW